MKNKILIIDDEKAIRDILKVSLEDEGFLVNVAEDGESGIEEIIKFRPDIVLLDIWMPGTYDGLDVLNKIKPQFPSVQFIVMSGHGTIETAVRATKLGAWDFVEKPLSIDKIQILITNILNLKNEVKQKNILLNRLRQNIALLGSSQRLMSLKKLISKIAASQAWVLIQGEKGTGKSICAQNIHYLSNRVGGPFIEYNCSANSPELEVNELFGINKLSEIMTIKSSQVPKIAQAHGGTLYLKEVCDLGLESQNHLLEYLQNKIVLSAEKKELDVDVRIIASTSKNIELEVKKGRFNSDLYYRLNIVPFKVPSLVERLEDVPTLINHFNDQFSIQTGYQRKTFSDKAVDVLMFQAWTGNVLELRNFVERVNILTQSNTIEVSDLQIAGLNTLNFESSNNFRDARASFEKEYLQKVIDQNDGNISKTAEAIGLERSYLHRKIKSYGIEL